MNAQKFTQKSLEAIQWAQDAALSRGSMQIEQQHLLLALVEQQGGLIPQLLQAAGSNTEVLRRELDTELSRIPAVSGSGREPDKVYVSQEVDRTLIAAEKQAADMKDAFVSVEHIFLALLDKPNAALSRVFTAAEVDKNRFLSALAAVRGNQRVTSDNPEETYDVLKKYGQDLVELARKEKIDLVVPGPELPLTKGITDRMREAGIPCFGPDAYCARLEGSKAFAKDVMNRAGVPTAHSQVFTDPDKAKNAVVKLGAPLVVKADGLAAGKGVVVAMTTQEALDAVDDIMCKRAHGAAGAKLVIEEFLVGEEASFLCLCDGKTAVPLPSAQDHKAAYDGDQGPNTGGMGAYSPAPILPYNEAEAMADTVIRPILAALAKDGHPFVGVLYAGLMMTENGPKVLEYNTRFGDPECQPLLMRLEGDLVQIMLDCIEGKLRPESLTHTSQTALGVVVAAEGYPHAYPRGMVIEGLDEADALPGVKVFHSGTSMDGDKTLSSGGRVLCVTALGDTLADAQARAYEGVKAIRMDKSFHRSDIGQKGIRRLEQLAQEEK